VGERDTIPEVIPGLPIDRSTVSSVRSILRRERVRISCFLLQSQNICNQRKEKEADFEDLFPRLDSSNIHS
jgi:hypothetical protein